MIQKGAKMASKNMKVSDMTDAQRKAIGQRVVKMKKAGNGWPEIIKATGIAGGLTGRKLLREFGGKSAESLIRNSYDRSATNKGRTTKSKARAATSTRKTSTTAKGKSSRARGGSATKTRNKGRRS
jgi:hypothetical protein